MIGGRIAGPLLGSHVGRRPQHHAERGGPGPARAGRGAERLGDAEVGHHGGAGGEEDVVGLDVAVDDAVLVGVGEGPGHVAEQAHHLGEWERTPREPRAERLALDVGHGVVGQPVALARREQGDDVRVGEPGGEPDLLAEALAAHRVRQLGGQDLDHHPAPERGLLGDEDAGHATAA